MAGILSRTGSAFGRLFKRSYDYGALVYNDYQGVLVEAAKDCRNRPLKASVYFSGLGFLFYAYKTNPDENSFRQQLVQSITEMGLVHPDVRNPASYDHVCHLNQLDSERVLKPLSLCFFSVIFRQDYDPKCGLYNARCGYLSPTYISYLTERVVDIGVLGHWRILRHKLADYDVNPSEWPNAN